MAGFVTGPGAFRLLLALMVVASHLSNLEVGRPAVFIFFALSGYWVMKMYAEKYRPATTTAVFYLSRFLRIWLPFATAFLLAYLAGHLSGTGKPAAYLAGLVVFGIASNGLDVLGTSWSLDIELQFYAIVPLIWAALARGGGGIASLLVVTAALTVLGWYLQLFCGIWTVLSYLPAFVAGVLIWALQPQVTRSGAAISITVFVATGMCIWLLPFTRPLLLKDIPGPFHEDWFGLAWLLALVPFLAWNVRQKSGPLDMAAGNFSYALYIVHWPVIAVLRPMLQPLSPGDRAGLLFAALLISAVFYLGIDRPCEHLRRRILQRLSGAGR